LTEFEASVWDVLSPECEASICKVLTCEASICEVLLTSAIRLLGQASVWEVLLTEPEASIGEVLLMCDRHLYANYYWHCVALPYEVLLAVYEASAWV